MKSASHIIIILLTLSFLSSCKKDSINEPTLSSLNIINASQDVPALSVNFTFNPIAYSKWLGPNQSPFIYGSNLQFGNPSGNLPLELISLQDTLHSFYKSTLNLKAGGVYSLYIIGQNQPETMFLEDHIPAYQDSTSGVRFINLSPDSQPVTINLVGNSSNQTEFTSLAYKQISNFKAYPAKSDFIANGYAFEVRDAATGNLLTTFTWYIKPFFCNTLVFYGLENDNTGNFPINVFQVNHY
jgi:hypothetical protein